MQFLLCSNAYDDTILKFLDWPRRQKSKYLENEALFFLQIEKLFIVFKDYNMLETSFLAEVTFN